MAETSYFWEGFSQGDAVNHPIRQDELAKFFSLVTQLDRSIGSVIWTRHSDYDGKLAVSVVGLPAPYDIQVLDGAAIIDGTMYLNDSTITESDVSSTDTVNVVVKKTWSGTDEKTIRIDFPISPHSLIQSQGDTWEVKLSDYLNGSVVDTMNNPLEIRPGIICKCFYDTAKEEFTYYDAGGMIVAGGRATVTSFPDVFATKNISIPIEMTYFGRVNSIVATVRGNSGDLNRVFTCTRNAGGALNQFYIYTFAYNPVLNVTTEDVYWIAISQPSRNLS